MSISGQINPSPIAIQDVVGSLVRKRGIIDTYCWYEGPQGLARTGATFYNVAPAKILFYLPVAAKKVCDNKKEAAQ